MTDIYEATFGDAPGRLTRGRILADVVGLPFERIPRFRDAWCERWQNPDAALGVGPLVIVIYCDVDTERILKEAKVSARVFDVRANPYYRDETPDGYGFTAYRFNIPATTDPDTIHAMAARAVAPVDTDLRWATALGFTRGTS